MYERNFRVAAREFLFDRYRRKLRHSSHAIFMTCWFWYEQTMMDLGLGDANLVELSGRLGMAPRLIARCIIGEAPRGYYCLELAQEWCMLLSWSWLEHGGPAGFMTLTPDGEAALVPVWPEPPPRMVEAPLARARREYRDRWMQGRSLEDQYRPIFEAQSAAPDYARRKAAPRRDRFTPVAADMMLAGLRSEPNPTPELVAAYERAREPLITDAAAQTAYFNSNPFNRDLPDRPDTGGFESSSDNASRTEVSTGTG
jgi:hypothetical protein